MLVYCVGMSVFGVLIGGSVVFRGEVRVLTD